MVESLWGDLPEPSKVESPLYILREQASLLEKETNGALVGNVVATRSRSNESAYDFDIIVPALDNYVYSIAQLTFTPALFYPAKLHDLLQPRFYVARDDGEFRSMLKDVLTSAGLRQVISKLLTAAGAT